MRSISTLFILFLFVHRCRLSLQNLALPLMLLQKWLTRQVQMIIAASKDQPHLSATMRPPSGDVLLKKTKWQHTLLKVVQEDLDITAHLSSFQVKEKQTTFLYGDVVGVVAAWRRQNWWLYLNCQITKTFVCIKVTSLPLPAKLLPQMTKQLHVKQHSQRHSHWQLLHIQHKEEEEEFKLAAPQTNLTKSGKKTRLWFGDAADVVAMFTPLEH